MRFEDYLNSDDANKVEEIIKDPQNKFIIHCCKQLLDTDDLEFAQEFDYWLAKAFTIPLLPPDDSNRRIEETFYTYLGFKLIRGIHVLDEYMEHAHEISKEISVQMTDTYDVLHFKLDFYNIKARDVDIVKMLKEIKINKPSGTAGKEIAKGPLINGRKLNISDRYFIACQVLDIETKLNSLSQISATDKHILLSHILKCNQQTARELFNGTHQKRTPVQEDIVLPYLDSLKLNGIV